MMKRRPHRQWLKTFPGAWTFGLLLACSVQAAESASSSRDGEELGNRLQAAVEDSFVGQVVVGSRQEILWSGVFGAADPATGAAVSRATVFDIGSITKQMTATAVLKLASEGRLKLGDRLGEHFTGLEEPAASITLHQLLTHTSGLPLYSGDDYRLRSARKLDRWLAKGKLESPPGERFSYSNPGYSVLARIIEKVSGRAYEDYLREELWLPLGLSNLGYRGLDPEAQLAVGYRGPKRWGDPLDKKWMADGPSWNLRGNGGLLMSAETLYRWLVAVADHRVLAPEWTAKLFERHAVRNAERQIWYGYGWGILDRPWGEVVDHTGGNGIFFADARWFRQRDLFLTITCSNFAGTDIGGLLRALRTALGIDPRDE